jgi:hypothetical protein
VLGKICFVDNLEKKVQALRKNNLLAARNIVRLRCVVEGISWN